MKRNLKPTRSSNLDCILDMNEYGLQMPIMFEICRGQKKMVKRVESSSEDLYITNISYGPLQKI